MSHCGNDETGQIVLCGRYLNNRRTGKDATKPRTLGLLGHSALAVGPKVASWWPEHMVFIHMSLDNFDNKIHLSWGLACFGQWVKHWLGCCCPLTPIEKWPARSFLNWKFVAKSLPLVVENWHPVENWLHNSLMIQKIRLEKLLTINLKRGGVNFQRWILTPYIMINSTFHDLKVKTGEMAYH